MNILRFTAHFLIIAITVMAIPHAARAQLTMIQQNPLGFGLFGISRNNIPATLSVDINGNVINSGAFIMTGPAPQPARLTLSGMPANQPVSITFGNGTMSLNGSGTQPLFTVINFTSNGPFVTAPDGTMEIIVGATLRSSGNGMNYSSGTYSGGFDITINY